MAVDTRAPYTTLEWEACKLALRGEREDRRRRKQVNADGIVLFSQQEQADLIHRVILALRS